jgi:hypothetical protein
MGVSEEDRHDFAAEIRERSLTAVVIDQAKVASYPQARDIGVFEFHGRRGAFPAA